MTPIGNNVTDTWNNLKSGKNGIAPISLFDTSNLKSKLGAEVKDFDPKEYLEVNETLRTDRYAQFAVAAAKQAVDELSLIHILFVKSAFFSNNFPIKKVTLHIIATLAARENH